MLAILERLNSFRKIDVVKQTLKKMVEEVIC